MTYAYIHTIANHLKLAPASADVTFMESESLLGLFGGVINIVALCIFAAGVMKVFQIATTLGEIKDAVKAIQRDREVGPHIGRSAASGVHVSTSRSGDEMLRELDAQLNLHPSDELPLRGEIINPR